jgi:hypothetical protein
MALGGIAGLVAAVFLFFGSIALYSRIKTAPCLLQLFGTGFILVVVLVHMCEQANWFPWMNWGARDSVGHYLNLASAVLGVGFFSIGYLLHALDSHST